MSAHELSHHWWGNSVSLGSWHDVWLKEGFASYSEALWWENVYGPYGLQNYMTRTQGALGLTESVYRYDVTDPGQIFVSEVYDKGSWVLHMLRHVLGDDAFFDILQQVYETYAYGNYVTEEFQNACEQVSGQDLDWFFQEWVYDVWHPEYYWGWSAKDIGASYQISGFIDQTQEDGPTFTMPLDMGVVSPGGDTTIVETLWIDERSERFQFVVEEEPVEVLLDPYNWVLKEQSVVTAPVVSYATHWVDDSGGNGDGRADPGETVNVIVTLNNTGVDVFELSAHLSTTDPDIEITAATSAYGDMDHGAAADNEGSPYSLKVSSGIQPHVVTFTLTFTGQGGYTGVDSFYLTVGTPTVLMVDDDGGEASEGFYVRPLAAKGIPFQVWDVSIEGSPGDTLRFFDVVVWFTGAARESTLTASDQADIAAYLGAGGRLFLSGQDIGHDLAELGRGPDFFTNYLHASFVTDVSDEYFLQGVSGDPISGQFGLLQLDAQQESPDVISPVGGANITLEYSPSGNAAGVKYGGDYRVVYFSVGFEGIKTLTGDPEPMRADMLDNIITWLQFEPTKGDVNEDGQINIIDVVWTVNILLGLITPTPSQEWAADFNEDGSVNIIDAIQIVNEILGPGQG
ncbi:MAG: M1 family aminopeptidase [bacterium]